MNNDGNIEESLVTASYVMAPDGRFRLAEQRPFALGDVRVNVRGQVIYYVPPASLAQEEMLTDQAESLDWPLYQDWGKTRKPIWLPVIMEGLEGLKFTHEANDYRHGETFMTLYARLGEQVVGYIYYSLYLDEINIKYIHVNEDKRRGGIATAMARNLQAEYPDKEIDWGGLTDEGSAFLKALNREFEPDPMHAELTQALDAAKAEYNALQAEFDAWIAAKKGMLSQDMLMKGERMNELDNLIYDLEDQLRDSRPGRWRVMTESDMTPDEMSGLVRQALTLKGDWERKDTEAVVGPVVNWTLYLDDPNGRITPDSYLFLRDQGLDYGTTRGVWFLVHIDAPINRKDLWTGRQEHDRFENDVAFFIRPEPEEFERLKEAVKEGFFKMLRKPLLLPAPFNLERFRAQMHALCGRIQRAFQVDRDIR